MFRRTLIPNIQFKAATSTPVESFSATSEPTTLVVTLCHQEKENPVPNKAFAKSPEGGIVEVAFSSPAPQAKSSIQIVYKLW